MLTARPGHSLLCGTAAASGARPAERPASSSSSSSGRGTSRPRPFGGSAVEEQRPRRPAGTRTRPPRSLACPPAQRSMAKRSATLPGTLGSAPALQGRGGAREDAEPGPLLSSGLVEKAGSQNRIEGGEMGMRSCASLREDLYGRQGWPGTTGKMEMSSREGGRACVCGVGLRSGGWGGG